MPGPGRRARVSESHPSPLCRQREHRGEPSIIGKPVHQRPGHSSEWFDAQSTNQSESAVPFHSASLTGEERGQEASSFTVTPILVVRLDSVGGAQAQGPPTLCGALSAGVRLPKARRLCCPWTDSDEGALPWSHRKPSSCEASSGLKADALSSKVQGPRGNAARAPQAGELRSPNTDRDGVLPTWGRG